MRKFTTTAAAEAEGEWFVHHTDTPEDPTQAPIVVRYKLRAIPDDISVRMEQKVLGSETPVYLRKGGREVRIDPAKHRLLLIDQCLYSFLDSENERIQLGDDGSVELVKKIFPAAKVGDIVTLDGHWTDPLKRAVLIENDSEFRNWMRERFDKIGRVRADDEEGKD